jgi:hypothetical protein
LPKLTAPLLPNTKTPKDPPQQIIGVELAGDLVERLLGGTQFFGHQFTGA